MTTELPHANRFVQVETVTNVPAFLTGFIQSPVRPNMLYIPIRLKKRRSTAALQNVTALRAQNSRLRLGVRRCSAALGSSGRLCATLINPTDPQAN
jgi:hypothetical protein